MTLIVALMMCPAFTALAQTAAQRQQDDRCSSPYEVIIPLRLPVFGASTDYRTLVGDPGFDRLIAAYPAADGNLAVFGDSAPEEGKGTLETITALIDNRGRVVKEERIVHEKLKAQRAAIPFGVGFLTAGEMVADDGAQAVQIGVYDKKGNIIKQKIFREEGYDLTAYDFLAGTDDTAYLMAWSKNRKVENDNFTILYAIGPDGEQKWKRAYLPGIPNQMNKLLALPDGTMIGLGKIQIDAQRTGGWVMQLTKDGGMVWQKTYPRGVEAALSAGAMLADKSFILGGESHPADGGPAAAMLLKVDSVGNPTWQRFAVGNFRYNVNNLFVLDDGRIQLVVNARPPENFKTAKPHIRIISFSAQGVVVGDDAYIEGSAAEVNHSLMLKSGKRFLVGSAQTGFVDGKATKEQIEAAYEGLIIGLPVADPYVDPCKSKPMFE